MAFAQFIAYLARSTVQNYTNSNLPPFFRLIICLLFSFVCGQANEDLHPSMGGNDPLLDSFTVFPE
jgi:hypothetical protein